jgi:hypothetical protein
MARIQILDLEIEESLEAEELRGIVGGGGGISIEPDLP